MPDPVALLGMSMVLAMGSTMPDAPCKDLTGVAPAHNH